MSRIFLHQDIRERSINWSRGNQLVFLELRQSKIVKQAKSKSSKVKNQADRQTYRQADRQADEQTGKVVVFKTRAGRQVTQKEDSEKDTLKFYL